MPNQPRSVRFTDDVELRPTQSVRQPGSASPAASAQFLSPDTAYSTSQDAHPHSQHGNQTQQQRTGQPNQQGAQLRPRRSLVMRGRIRRLEPDFGYDTSPSDPAADSGLQRRFNTRKSSLPVRQSQGFRPIHGGNDGDGEHGANGGLQRKPSRFARWWHGAAGVGVSPMDHTSHDERSMGLGDHRVDMAGADKAKFPQDDDDRHDDREAYEMQSTKRLTLAGARGYSSLESIDKLEDDQGDNPHHLQHLQALEDNHMQRKRSLVDRLHGHRPDRHLFPYRTFPENLHAARTFFRRFFLVLLVVPAYVLPAVLNKQAAAAAAEEDDHGEGKGGGAHGIELSKTANVSIFVLNMLCMMHLGKAAGACLEELVPKYGAHVVSVLDAMTSSTVEMAVAAFALKKGLIRVVQAAMLGAILNNLLLILGITIVVGGFYHKEQMLQPDTTQTGMNILMLATISFVVPVTLSSSMLDARTKRIPPHLSGRELIDATLEVRRSVDHDILALSKILAIILLVIYAACLSYQYINRHFLVTPEDKHTGEYEVHHRHTHYWFAGLAYVGVLGMQIYSAYLLVHSVEALGRQLHLTDAFVGFILLPIVLVADLQEEVIAIKESRHGRLDRSVALMIGSCMQLALLVTPLLVILGWIIDVPMSFRFTIMESTILVVSVLLVNFLIQDSKTNYLEGVILLASFLMAAMAFYYDKEPFSMVDGKNSIGGGDHSTAGGGH
ncbi:hypothetical protein BGZ73_000172 [Actinomortierella ambigua]|nr:hypothetical protein BGZ73_000172 [Actinomortierella ambigua]